MEKIKVLIVTGNLMPMHDYRRVNDVLRVTLEATGHFTVRITEEAHGITAETLAPYDMVLMNYDGMEARVARGGNGRSFPSANEITSEIPFRPLGDTTLNALFDFVSSGHGVLFFHTAARVEPAFWPDAYNELIGARYGDKAFQPYRDLGYSITTHHENNHPITQGVSAHWRIADDDYLSNITLLEGSTLIASIYDPVNDYDGPIMWCKQYGKGRSFGCTIGHQEDTIRRLDFCRLLIHACDWCATGKTDVPLPDRDSGDNWMRSWPWYYCKECGLSTPLIAPIGY